MRVPNKKLRQAGGLSGVQNVLCNSQSEQNSDNAGPVQVATPSTPAGLYVHRRFRINPLIADIAAALAGLGPDRRVA